MTGGSAETRPDTIGRVTGGSAETRPDTIGRVTGGSAETRPDTIGRVTGGSAELRRGAELLALTGLAITQPVLDVLGDSPETFVFRGVEGTQLVLFALGVALLPALVLWLLAQPSRLLGTAGREVVQVVLVASLVGTAVLVASRLGDLAKGGPVLALAVGASLTAGYLYVRHRGARLFLWYLSPLPLVAAALFLFASPVSGLVTGGDVDVVEDVAGTRPVVMMVLDELPTAALLGPDGTIDAAQFPALARLSREATWFRNYTTHNAGTVQAVPSLLSGDLPTRGRAPLYTDWPDNLFTLLGGTYDMAVQESVTRLCPPEVCDDGDRTVTQRTALAAGGVGGLVEDTVEVVGQLVSLNAEPEVQVDAFAEEVLTVPAPENLDPEARDAVTNQPARLTSFLDGLVPAVEPTLHFVHLILPHGPWRFFPDGTEYESPEGDPEGEIAGTWTDAWPAELTRLRLELQAQYTDALVGQTLDRLQATGLWEDALVVVVTDHGGSFLVDQPGRALSDTNAHEVMWTPLFIRDPALEPGVDDTDVEAADLLPTMADLLGITLPYEVEGASAVSDPDTSGTKRYQRLQNPFQPEPDALVDIDTAGHYRRLLRTDWPRVDVDDPVGGFYRLYPPGDLYRRPVADLATAEPAGSAALDQLEAAVEGDDGPQPAYLGGQVTLEDVDPDDAWVIVAVDGVIEGFSPLFPMLDTDTAFSILLAQDVVGAGLHDIDLYVTDDPGAPLRPLSLS